MQAFGPSPDECSLSGVRVSESRTKKSTPQFAVAKRAAALKSGASKVVLSPRLRAANDAHVGDAALASDEVRRQHDGHHLHGARASPAVRLLGKGEVVAIVGVSYPTLWTWMRKGRFPRSRIVGGKSKWLSSEIDGWLTALPVRRLKGDDLVEAVA